MFWKSLLIARIVSSLRGKYSNALTKMKTNATRRPSLQRLKLKPYSRWLASTWLTGRKNIVSTVIGKRKQEQTDLVRVVTDIDDTIKSSGGVKLFGIPLGGVDKRLKRGEFYPGGTQFSYELSSYSKATGRIVEPLSVAVITARAKELKFALALRQRGKLCSAYRHIGEKNGDKNWGIDTVFYGSIIEWLFSNRKGIRKFKNFEKLLKHDKDNKLLDYNYIFIGDTGEKDEDAANRMMQDYPTRLKAVFLHVVSDNGVVSVPPDRVCNGVPVLYFRTYIGAAVKAFHLQLINKEGLAKITEAARFDLDNISVRHVATERNRWLRRHRWKSFYQGNILYKHSLNKTSSLQNDIMIEENLGSRRPPFCMEFDEDMMKAKEILHTQEERNIIKD